MTGRQIFSESEKLHLQELIVNHKLSSSSTKAAGNPSLKKQAWARLVAEYNSNETNSKRTEAQLKKCWDNLKTRKKVILAQEIKDRMQTGGGPFNPKPGPSADPMLIDEALVEETDIKLQYVIDVDNLPTDTPGDTFQVEAIQPLIETASDGKLYTYAATTDHETEAEPERGTAKNRSHVINEEFMMRKANYHRQQEREEELHKLIIEEKKWLVKAAEEIYKKAVLERQNAEALLHSKAMKKN